MGRAGKRPPPAMRRLRRTGRLVSRRAVPAVATAIGFPPPVAAILDPAPFASAIGRVTSSQATEISPMPAVHRDRREHEGVGRAVIRDAFAHDYTGIVDGLGDGEHAEIAPRKISDGVEIGHFSVGKKEGMHAAVFHRREPDDQSRRIDAERAALVSAQGPKISRYFVGTLESMISSGLGDIRRADDIRRVVPIGRAAGAAERPEVLHFAILKQKGVKRTVRRQRRANDVTVLVDPVGRAGRPAKRAEVGDVET